ncbi:MAG: hypothetical protein HYZ62_00955 [Candidatus Andersenbacteria bacterium]|nr:hypothetical protein [Candidatus Andersenbacteria bacterium]
MAGKYVLLLNRFYTYLYLVGAVCLLVFLGAVSVGWFDRQTYLLIFGVVLSIIALLLLAIFLVPSLMRMIQLRDMENTHPVNSSAHNLAQPTPGQPLSKDKARQWLDDFLVEQQRQGGSDPKSPFTKHGTTRDKEIKK